MKRKSEGAQRATRRGSSVLKEQRDKLYTVANVPLDLLQTCVWADSLKINKILLYNRGYGVIKRVKILMERKSPTNHL